MFLVALVPLIVHLDLAGLLPSADIQLRDIGVERNVTPGQALYVKD